MESTTVNILSLHIHVTWHNDQEGYDSHGNKWLDKTNPRPENPQLMDSYLDFHNGILKDLEAFRSSQDQKS